MSAYNYDAYTRMLNLHTDSDGSDSVQIGFSIDNAGLTPYSGTADTATWYAYDYDVSRWPSRDPVGENGVFTLMGDWAAEFPIDVPNANPFMFTANSAIDQVDWLGLKNWKCDISEVRVCACVARCKAYCRHQKQGYCDCSDNKGYYYHGPWDEGSNVGVYFSFRCCFRRPFDPNAEPQDEFDAGTVWEDIPFRVVREWEITGGPGNCCLL